MTAPWKSRLIGQDTVFQGIRDSYDDLPHLFITGPPGSGKTTFIEDILSMIKAEAPFSIESILWLSSEKDRGIHTIRDKVNDFCKRSHSKPNSLRFIVIDDADSLPLISQQALRRPMEQYSHLTRFIFASRYAGHLIEPLRSRCFMLELEPAMPLELVQHIAKELGCESSLTPDFITFIVSNFITIHQMKCVLKLFSAMVKEGHSLKVCKQRLLLLISSSNQDIQNIIYGLSMCDGEVVRKAITQLYLKGFLLDDILLGIEKTISLFPSTDPERRFLILHFVMLGWISIQQGKEHWMDTMDILDQVLRIK